MSAGGGISLPFTAIGAKSLSSPGPPHCAVLFPQSCLRPHSEGKADRARAPAPRARVTVRGVIYPGLPREGGEVAAEGDGFANASSADSSSH